MILINILYAFQKVLKTKCNKKFNLVYNDNIITISHSQIQLLIKDLPFMIFVPPTKILAPVNFSSSSNAAISA